MNHDKAEGKDDQDLTKRHLRDWLKNLVVRMIIMMGRLIRMKMGMIVNDCGEKYT